MTKPGDSTRSGSQTLQVEVVVPRRKEPRQSRSIALVEALKIAGRDILEKEGRAALTVQRLSEAAGVSVSSIYEYFPTLGGLIAAIFDDYREAIFLRLSADIQALPPSATLFDGVLLVVAAVLDMRRREVELDREVGIKRLQVDELQRLELLKANAPAQARASLELIQRFPDEIDATNLDKILFMNIQMVQAMVRVIALERPQYLTEHDTVVMLARMLHALLTTRPER
jgi:AcrR family transcriptional regulator